MSRSATRGRVRVRIAACVIEVESDGAEVLESLAAHFGEVKDSRLPLCASLRVTRARGRDEWSLEFEGREAVVQLGQEWPRLEDLLILLAVRERRDLRFVHASAVSTERGAALFVGGSTSGKTTLSLALDGAGFTVLCDDVAPVQFTSARVLRLLTKPSLRPATVAMVGHPRKEKSVSDDEREEPVRWMFFLQPDSGQAEEVPVGDVLERWHTLYWLGTGEAVADVRASDALLRRRNERSFHRPPRLARCPAGVGLKQLLNHLHPPSGPVASLIAEAGALARQTAWYLLEPGYLAETVGLVEDVIKGEGHGEMVV